MNSFIIVGHIQIDYRICAAMYNFYNTPFCTDGKREEEIAKRLKTKTTQIQQINFLQSLLSKRLNTKALMPIKRYEIDDFVRLSLEHLNRKIFMSPAVFDLVESYLPNLSEEAYQPNNEL